MSTDLEKTWKVGQDVAVEGRIGKLLKFRRGEALVAFLVPDGENARVKRESVREMDLQPVSVVEVSV